MVYVATHPSDHRSGRGLLQSIVSFFRALDQGWTASRESERLYAMSDYALALHGLTRQEIPAYIATRYLGINASR